MCFIWRVSETGIVYGKNVNFCCEQRFVLVCGQNGVFLTFFEGGLLCVENLLI